MSRPIAVRSWPIRDPLCSVPTAREFTAAPAGGSSPGGSSAGGTRSMYCSPMADTLLTVAVTLSGIGVPVLSRISASTPSPLRCTACTRPTVTPR
ncbi:hypothetical protein C1Y40_00487 [Mycobacterium talmoniae]|uniref:Uncharacterized protein n=1 Tax=Mycobacterium talmoniae TaxID=1858794 RepID=A0A2S8BRJ1_9MYCO|nr:hypothetical protein C1Y40_00487 [Mycobacterium talmoniae]